MKYLSILFIITLSFLITDNSKAQTQLNLLGQLTYTDGLNDIWGYADAAGRESGKPS